MVKRAFRVGYTEGSGYFDQTHTKKSSVWEFHLSHLQFRMWPHWLILTANLNYWWVWVRLEQEAVTYYVGAESGEYGMENFQSAVKQPFRGEKQNEDKHVGFLVWRRAA